MSTKFYVKFDSEEGQDLDDVTKELFFPSGMLLGSNIGKEQASHVLLLRGILLNSFSNALDPLGRILWHGIFFVLFTIAFSERLFV